MVQRVEVTGAGGLPLACLTAGDPGAGCVAFIHGNGAGAGQFHREVAGYADRYRTLAVSLRGHGGSAMPEDAAAPDLSIARLADDVAAAADRLGIARAHVVGNSVGGLVAFELSARRPDLVASLVTFGTTAALESSRATAALVAASPLILRRRAMAALVALTARPGLPRAQVRAVARQADPRAVSLISRNVGTYDYTDALRQRAVPWLLLRGGRDRSINRQLGSTLAAGEAAPWFRLVELPRAGHFANVDDPQGFDAAVRPFLDEVDAARA